MFGNMSPEQAKRVDRWARLSQWLSGIGLAILLAPFVLGLLALLIVALVVIF